MVGYPIAGYVVGALDQYNAKSIGGEVSFQISTEVDPLYVHATPSKLLDWALAAVEQTAIVRPVTPEANIFIPPPYSGSWVISGDVSQTMTDKMARATFLFDTALHMPGTYFRHINFEIPDYTGTPQSVFVGFFPSGKSTYGADGDFQSITAFDYSWYLTMQYLTDDNMVLLTPEDQMVDYRYMLYYHYPQSPLYWEVGQVIEGASTGHIARIIENHLIGSWPVNEGSYIIIAVTSGVPISGHYFQDDEQLLVNGVFYATADGHTMDVTGTVDPVLPHEYVCRLLGGDDTGSQYERMTGILPYRITAVDWSATSDPIAVEFDFEEKTTKMQAIERICKYIRYVFMVRTLGTRTVAYFIPEANIDLAAPYGLDLPAAQTIHEPDPYLVSPVTQESREEERYNKVTVRCQSLEGTWYQSVLPATPTSEIPVEYYEINQDIASQEECDARCADIYAYYCEQIQTWNATFNLRSDLRLLQKLVFSGYGNEIPNNTYRIVGINYNYADGGTTNEVVCTIVPYDQFKFYLNLNRVFTDTISETQSIVQGELAKLAQSEVATVLRIDGGAVTVKTERGITKIVRNP